MIGSYGGNGVGNTGGSGWMVKLGIGNEVVGSNGYRWSVSDENFDDFDGEVKAITEKKESSLFLIENFFFNLIKLNLIII